MTEPDEAEVKKAQQTVDEALSNARSVRDRSVKIGEGWAQSRQDNNFRLMLRNLGRGEAPHAT